MLVTSCHPPFLVILSAISICLAGKLLKRMTHQLLKSVDISDVSVSKCDGKIAVACGTMGVRLFSISRRVQ